MDGNVGDSKLASTAQTANEDSSDADGIPHAAAASTPTSSPPKAAMPKPTTETEASQPSDTTAPDRLRGDAPTSSPMPKPSQKDGDREEESNSGKGDGDRNSSRKSDVAAAGSPKKKVVRRRSSQAKHRRGSDEHGSSARPGDQGGGGPDAAGLIQVITKHDVLLGRGRPYQDHPGNLKMHRIVNLYRSHYTSASRADKPVIAKMVLNAIRGEGNARFLRRAEGPASSSAAEAAAAAAAPPVDYWEEVSEEVARDKISHAFRNRARRGPEHVEELERENLQLQHRRLLASRTAERILAMEDVASSTDAEPTGTAASELQMQQDAFLPAGQGGKASLTHAVGGQSQKDPPSTTVKPSPLHHGRGGSPRSAGHGADMGLQSSSSSIQERQQQQQPQQQQLQQQRDSLLAQLEQQQQRQALLAAMNSASNPTFDSNALHGGNIVMDGTNLIPQRSGVPNVASFVGELQQGDGRSRANIGLASHANTMLAMQQEQQQQQQSVGMIRHDQASNAASATMPMAASSAPPLLSQLNRISAGSNNTTGGTSGSNVGATHLNFTRSALLQLLADGGGHRDELPLPLRQQLLLEQSSLSPRLHSSQGMPTYMSSPSPSQADSSSMLLQQLQHQQQEQQQLVRHRQALLEQLSSSGSHTNADVHNQNANASSSAQNLESLLQYRGMTASSAVASASAARRNLDGGGVGGGGGNNFEDGNRHQNGLNFGSTNFLEPGMIHNRAAMLAPGAGSSSDVGTHGFQNVAQMLRQARQSPGPGGVGDHGAGLDSALFAASRGEHRGRSNSAQDQAARMMLLEHHLHQQQRMTNMRSLQRGDGKESGDYEFQGGTPGTEGNGSGSWGLNNNSSSFFARDPGDQGKSHEG